MSIDHPREMSEDRILGPVDPPPLRIHNAAGRSAFLLTGDHAGRAIPARLGTLGLEAEQLARHIACDIGIAGLGQALADRMDAPFLSQSYSRLVVDCNRDPSHAEAIAEKSDGTVIPGNAGLTQRQRQSRIDAIHSPYHAGISARIAAGRQPPVLIALHSFTPVLAVEGRARPWHVGVLHDGGDARFALALRDALRVNAALVVGDNQPYRMDATDYSVPHHAFARGAARPLSYAEIEVRQDLIATPAGQQHWCEILAIALHQAGREARAIG